MRKYTTEFTVYTYDELSAEAKEKALEGERKFVNDTINDFLPDDLDYKLEELLDANKIKFDDSPKIYYSLNYSQGDGAMFEGKVYWRGYVVEIRQNGHYYHYNSKTFWNFTSVKTGKDASDKAFKEFNALYVSICKDLAAYGYDCIDAALSDENLIENIKANDYEYFANGEMA